METSPIRVADLLALQRAVLERLARRAATSEVLQELCRLVEGLVPGAICTVMRFHAETSTLELVAAPSAPDVFRARMSGIEASATSGNCAVAVVRKTIVVVADTSLDPLWSCSLDLADELGIRSCWSVPFFSAGGEVLGSLGISRRVTGSPSDVQLELLRTAGTLAGMAIDHALQDRLFREQETLLASILHSSEDPIFAKDLEGRYLIANAAETRGRLERPDDVVGLTDEQLFPDQLEVCRRTDAEVLRTLKGIHYEHAIENPVLGQQTFLVRKSPLRGPDGEVRGVLGISRDVTELRRTEEALRRTQKLEWLGVLTGGIAHDFNNILTGILGNSELALAHLPASSPERRNLLEIRLAAVRAAELIRQMQAYAGMGERGREVLSLPEIVRETFELISGSLSRNARLDFDVAEGLPPVEVDATQIRQVVMNLITNAVEALEEAPGTIGVRLRRVERTALPEHVRSQVDASAGAFVALRVADTGCGMDEATQARIFDPFFSTKFEGRGLGLAATLGIVRQHGGAIEVQSRPGSGAVFTIYLPATAAPLEIRPVPPPKPPAPEPRGRVLVVDDEPQVRKLLGRVLERGGFEIATAEDGSSALALLESDPRPFELVLLDHTMPGLGPVPLLKRLSELRPDMVVVVSSGHPESKVRHDLSIALASGARLDGFLKKPYASSEILDVVRRALAAPARG